MTVDLPLLITLAGIGQLGVLIASALVPQRLAWREALASLPVLHRQMYWTYGAYVVLAIIACAVIALVNARELAAGGLLARCVCAYIAVFWGGRCALQAVFVAKPYLTTWWLRLGYHVLTVLFVYFTAVFGWAAVHPVG